MGIEAFFKPRRVFVTAARTCLAFSTFVLMEAFEKGRGPCPIHRDICNVEALPPSDHAPERLPTGFMLAAVGGVGGTNTVVNSFTGVLSTN